MTIKILQGLLIICLPIIIILSNLLVLINSTSYYKTLYKKENIYQNFQSKTDVDNATKELIGYLRGQNNLEDNIFSFQAKTHLKDVKNLMTFVQYLDIIAAVVLTATIAMTLYKKDFSSIKKSVVISAMFIAGLTVLAAIFSFLNFDTAFVIFHKIFFKNDLWLFPPEDNLIKLFPISFFIEFTRQLIINIFASVFVLLCLVYLLPKNDSTSN